MATWNRNVKIDAKGEYLVVTKTGNPEPQPLPPDPEPVPTRDPRTDTALDITTYGADRRGVGAQILYHAGLEVTLTGISMKDGGGIPAELEVSLNPAGKLLRLTDKGEDFAVYEYYVEGEVDGTAKRTDDPRIHNQP